MTAAYLNIFKRNPSAKVLVLTGAGISAESGLKTFRDNNGLWENHSVEEVATPEGFRRDPELVYRFYNERRAQLQDGSVHPNKAHEALAKLESQIGNNLQIVTQNVDNLHERAGNKNVLHMHGELMSAKCTQSQQEKVWTKPLDASDRCDCCTPAQKMRPDIVWFNEIPYHMDTIEKHLFECDLFVSIGTSGNVYPAAGFANMARQYGAHTLELNLEPSQAQNLFDEAYYAPASELIPRFVDECVNAISES